MFNLNLLIDISEGKPGMLVPLLSSPNTNLPYVQQMDEFMFVRELVPFLEYENYQTISSEATRSVNIGERGLIAFRSFDGSIQCGDIQEMMEYISLNSSSIKENAVLAAQLNRVESADFSRSYEGWRMVAEVQFEEEDQRKFWIDSEAQLFQKQKRIWNEIDPLDITEPSASSNSPYSSITEHSTEYLLRWLNNRSNFPAKDWTKVWHYVAARTPFDVRIVEIALSWLFYVGAEGRDLRQAKSLIYAVFNMASTGSSIQSLGEFLCDAVSSDLAMIYDFVRPQRLFEELLAVIGYYGDPVEALKVCEFAYNHLPKEEYILQSILETLNELSTSLPNYHRNPDDHESALRPLRRKDAPEVLVEKLSDAVYLDLERVLEAAD